MSAILAVAVLVSVSSVTKAGADTAKLFDSAGDAYHVRPLPIDIALSDETDHLLAFVDPDGPNSAARGDRHRRRPRNRRWHLSGRV